MLSRERRVPIEQLISRSMQVLEAVGMRKQDARCVAESLVTADARGVRSHGIDRLPAYVSRIAAGKINPRAEVTVVRERPGSLLVDADNGMGAAVALQVMDMLAKKASACGVATAVVRRSNHFGAAGYIAERVVSRGMIGYAHSNGPPRMAPYGGRRPVFGTSPMAYAIPTGSGDPILIDMATCVAARGKIMLAAKSGQQIPEGWALDSEGNPTTDPRRALDGAVLPFSGPKGSGLALMIEVLAGVMGGGAWGMGVRDISSSGITESGTSHTLAALDIGAFAEPEDFFSNLTDLQTQVKEAPQTPGQPVQLPGELERTAERKANERGVPLSLGTVEELDLLFAQHDVPALSASS